MIEASHLTKEFGSIRAIDDVSFSIPRGEIAGFLGPNGAGKTTTMRILAGIFPPTSGRAAIAGFDTPTQGLEARRRLGYFPENAPYYPDLSVSVYLRTVGKLKGIESSRRARDIDSVLDACGLHQVATRLVGKLSKGYRQRVGLAQALLGDPEVLILDEPTVGLDPEQVTEIRSLIRSLAGQHTVILSTHILPEVSMVCDGVIIIHRGRIVAQGTESELVEQVFPTARVELQVAGPTGDVLAALRALPIVSRVEPVQSRDGATAFLVESPRDRDVRGELVNLAASRGWMLQELHQVGMSLEEVFIRVVAGEEADEGAPAEEEA